MNDVNLFKISGDLTQDGIVKTPGVAQNGRIANPKLRDLLDHAKAATKSEINCVLLGTIKAFYPDVQTADIEVAFWKLYRQSVPVAENQMADGYLKYPALINCPVFFLSGGLGRFTAPVEAGDTCIVLFCDKDMDTFVTTGQVGKPNSDRSHHLSDGIALVGIRTALNQVADYRQDGVEMRYMGNYLAIKSGGVEMNANGKSAATAFQNLLSTLKNATAGGNAFDAPTIAAINYLIILFGEIFI